MELSFKWQKILLLHYFNFATKIEIERLAHRFSINAVDEMLNEIEFHIKNNENCVFVIELIPIHHQYKLPNYLIKTAFDLSGVAGFIKDNNEKGYKEIWYYKKQEIQACGRILFSDRPLSNQVIEVIDGNTVRDLETKKYSFYFRATRIDWGWSYNIEECYLSDSKEASARNLLTNIFLKLEKQKTNVRHLRRFFNRLGLYDFTLDFLLIKGILYIIDWDTGNDKKVFSHLNNSGFNVWNEYYMNY